jgi:type IV secretory pathway TrbL component
MVHGVPVVGNGNVGIGVAAAIMLVLVVGAVVWTIVSDRRQVTTPATVDRAVSLHGSQASKEPEKTRKAA